MRNRPTVRKVVAPRRPPFVPFQRRTRLIALAAFALACLSLCFAGCACLRMCSAYAQALSDDETAIEGEVFADVEGSVEGVSSILLAVPSLSQNPELPTGCEAVALTDVLLFWGCDLEKTEIADEWLPCSDTDFVNAFLGDPRSEEGHACMAPCIAQTANAYLSSQGSELAAVDMTGASFDEVLSVVADGVPVIVWVTIGLEEPGEPYLTQQQGDICYELFAASHCLVVTGFDAAAQTVFASDPLEGTVAYDADLFALRYQQLGSQAVVVS